MSAQPKVCLQLGKNDIGDAVRKAVNTASTDWLGPRRPRPQRAAGAQYLPYRLEIRFALRAHLRAGRPVPDNHLTQYGPLRTMK